MIPDDLKDDEMLDDDFDIDDFDDGWDDQEDSGPSDADGVEPAQPVATGDKTLLQKLFIPIVIGVVVIFCGIFVAGQGLLSSGNTSTDISGEETTLPDDMAPDMASNSDAQPDVDALLASPADTDDTADIIDSSSLRPLPGDTESEQIELADLAAELQSDDEEAQALQNDALTPIENTLTPDIAVETLFDDTQEVTADGNIEDFLDQNDINIEAPAIEAPAEDIASNDSLLEGTAPINTPEDSTIAQDVIIPPVDVNTDNNIEALENEITTLKTENTALTQNVDNSREAIEKLNNEIASLRATIKEMQNSGNDGDAIIKPPAQEPAQKAAPKKVAKPAPIQKAPVRWTLKSAQPGKATISANGSSDLKTIEIGSIISGIGRVTSVNLENGKWVVRGTKGHISQ